MATYVIYAGASDGRVYSQSATYATARTTGGTLATTDTGSNDVIVGQTYDGSAYNIYEGFVQFDTSSVIGTITSATLDLYGNTDWDGVNGWTIRARLHDWGAGLTTADWVDGSTLSSKTLLATYPSSSFTTAGYNTFTDVAMPANVNQAGSTRIVLSSSRHEAGTVPGTRATTGDANDERLFFQTADTTGTSQDPKLTVVAVTLTTTTSDAYLVGAPTKTVTSDAVLQGTRTGTTTSDAALELGVQKLKRVLTGDTQTGSYVRIFGATAGQAYRVYSSGGSVLESAVADSNGKVQFTSAVNAGTRIVGFTDNTYATPLTGQWWRGTVATGNVFDADPGKIPTAGINPIATDGSFYYATSQYGSRAQIAQTATKQYIVYRTGGSGSSVGGSDGNVVVVRVDRATGLVDQGPVTLRSGIPDGHEFFTLVRAPNGKLRFIYGGYADGSTPKSLYLMESSNADDVTAWGSAAVIYNPVLAITGFAGSVMVDSSGNMHMIAGTLAGGDIIYGKATNAAPTTWTWTTLVSASGISSTDWGALMGDAVLEESGGNTYIHLCFGSYNVGGTFGNLSYRYSHYMKLNVTSGVTATKADGTSISLPRSFSASTGAVAGIDQVSSLYHYGFWHKITHVNGTPYLLLDNDRNAVTSTAGPMMVASWNGSSWVTNTITDLPMWKTNGHTSDTRDTRAINQMNWGVNIASRGSIVYVYAAIGDLSFANAYGDDGAHTGFRLTRFRSTDGFATYAADQILAEGYGAFTYADLYVTSGDRAGGAWGTGFEYPKVPAEDPATVLFGIVDRDQATVAVSTLTLTEVSSDAVLRLSRTKTTTSDAQLTATRTGTTTSDAVLGSTRVLALTSNAVLSTTTTTRTVAVASNARLGIPGSNPYIVSPTHLSSSQFGSASMSSAQFGSSGIAPSTQQPIS